MPLEQAITQAGDYILFISCLFILAGSILLTFKLRFIQLRCLPSLFKMLKHSVQNRHIEAGGIAPHKALLTAMSTTLGISTIVAPVIAISLGGPGALLGFLLTAFFGSAATYTEVTLSIQHRKQLKDGTIMGGPMQYLKAIWSAKMAKWYASCGVILMLAWSAAQANQLAAILDSPLMQSYRIPTIFSGGAIALFVLFILMGGIKRISSLSSKLVPVMFILYVTSSLWIIGCNIDKLGEVFSEVFKSALSPYALASGTLVGGAVSALRWGVFKGIQTSEAGIGTQAIPHSMAQTQDPMAQGALATLSTYTAGALAFLSGCVTLLTKTWQDPSLPLGISMVAASFERYFSVFGIAIVAISALLFGFGTILGNSYNGSQCYGYLTENRKNRYYLFAMACMIFLGAVTDVKIIWTIIDPILACMALPHITALIKHAFRPLETVVYKD